MMKALLYTNREGANKMYHDINLMDRKEILK